MNQCASKNLNSEHEGGNPFSFRPASVNEYVFHWVNKSFQRYHFIRQHKTDFKLLEVK